MSQSLASDPITSSGVLSFGRRDALKFVGVVIGVEVLSNTRQFTPAAAAADLTQRRPRSEFLSSIKDILAKAVKKHPNIVPHSLPLLSISRSMTVGREKRPRNLPRSPS